VLRNLGLKATSAQALRSVRGHADRLGLSSGHFTGQRRWSLADLAAAVAVSDNWNQVAAALGLTGGSSNVALKGHAARLGIDSSHFRRPREVPPDLPPMRADAEQLPRSGAMLAASWFSMCGYDVSWPLEPTRYDLAVRCGREFLRIQVKTSRTQRSHSWVVSLTSNSTAQKLYDLDEIDYFFIIDGDLAYYLVPITAVGGLHVISLDSYQEFKLDRGLAQPT
jgi:hypothetical protein